jgi:hypothetical protein
MHLFSFRKYGFGYILGDFGTFLDDFYKFFCCQEKLSEHGLLIDDLCIKADDKVSI